MCTPRKSTISAYIYDPRPHKPSLLCCVSGFVADAVSFQVDRLVWHGRWWLQYSAPLQGFVAAQTRKLSHHVVEFILLIISYYKINYHGFWCFRRYSKGLLWYVKLRYLNRIVGSTWICPRAFAYSANPDPGVLHHDKDTAFSNQFPEYQPDRDGSFSGQLLSIDFIVRQDKPKAFGDSDHSIGELPRQWGTSAEILQPTVPPHRLQKQIRTSAAEEELNYIFNSWMEQYDPRCTILSTFGSR